MFATSALLRPGSRLFWAAALVCGTALRLIVAGYTSDDAYISLTYARNLASGIGLVFNPGEHVYGFTNPGWTILTSLFFRVLPSQPAIAGIKLLALAAWLASAVLLYRLVLRHTGSELAARLLVFMWVLQPWSVVESMNGLETPAYAFCLLASLYLFLHERWGWANWALGVATLMRPEAGLLFVLVLVARTVERKQKAWMDVAQALIAFGLAALPWYLYALGFYGTWLPNSFYEKANFSLVLARQIVSQLALVAVSYAPIYLAVLAWWLTKRKPESPVVIAFVAWSAIMMGYYVVIPSFVRYFVGPGLIASFGLARPLADWAQTAASPAPGRMRLGGWIAPLVATYLVAWGVGGSLANLYFYNLTAQGFQDIHVYTARWIAQNTPADAVIAAHDVGALGFYARRYILDTTGLVSGRDQHQFNSPQEWLKSKRPEYLFVSLNWTGAFASTLDCKLRDLLVRQGHISFRTPSAQFVLYRCDWP